MPLLDNQLARRDGPDLHLRPVPVRVRWTLEDLATSDGHRLRCAFTCSVKLLDTPTERRMLEEAFLARSSVVTISNLADHFEPAFRTAASRVARTKPAGDWLGGDQVRKEMTDALREAGKSLAFACGVELLAPFRLDVESPSFQQQMLESMQRQLAEQRAAGQVAHAQRAMELLQQFDSMRAGAPHLRAGELLRHLTPSDQAPMLQTLTLAFAREAAAGGASELFAVAGPYLVRIDARANPVATQLLEPPTALGPLRSIGGAIINGEKHLLIGARSGVTVTRAGHLSDAQLLTDPEITSALGFSRAVYWNHGIWACHSDAGIVGWTLNDAGAPHQFHRPAQIVEHLRLPPLEPTSAGPRHLNVLDDHRLIFAMGRHAIVLDRDSGLRELPLEPARTAVAGIVLADREMIVVYESGEICRLRRDTLEAIARECRPSTTAGGRITAVAALPWLGGDLRLLLADNDGPVRALGLDDTLLTEYASPHRGARMLAAAPDLIAAVSPDRQRLILWTSWNPRHPTAELYLTATTKHRIADVDFV